MGRTAHRVGTDGSPGDRAGPLMLARAEGRLRWHAPIETEPIRQEPLP